MIGIYVNDRWEVLQKLKLEVHSEQSSSSVDDRRSSDEKSNVADFASNSRLRSRIKLASNVLFSSFPFSIIEMLSLK